MVAQTICRELVDDINDSMVINEVVINHSGCFLICGIFFNIGYSMLFFIIMLLVEEPYSQGY